MATVKLDKIDTLSIQERHGIITRCERKAIVLGLSNTDYTVLLSAINAAGVPLAGSLLPGATNLVLTERTPTVTDKDKVEVHLLYEHLMNEGQSFDSPPAGGVFCGELRTNLQQVSTNKDANGDLITVQHTYPADDPDFPSEVKTQTGEIQVYVPQRTFVAQGLKQTQYPWLIAWGIVGHVNSVPWSGAPERQWLCTAGNWKLADATAYVNKYFFTFEFQHNPDTWDPSAVFIDEKTNRPPANVVEGVGTKTILYLPGADFNQVIGTLLQGG